MTRAGMVFLLLASATRLGSGYLNTLTSEHVVDGGMGVLYGIAIGAMLVGLRRTCRA